MIPDDLPDVWIVGTPRRLTRDEAPGGHWEWLWVELEHGVGSIAVFDPDHACPPGQLGHASRIGLELFQPEVAGNDQRLSLIAPAPEATFAAPPPMVQGQVIAHHRYEWRYSGPVMNRDSQCGPAVTHVIDLPHVTVRLVIATKGGSLMAQLRDADRVPAIEGWVTLRGGRVELLTIAPWK